MALPSFKKVIFSGVPTSERLVGLLNQLVDQIQTYTSPLTQNNSLDSRLIESINVIGGSSVQVFHGLQRVPLEWTVVDISAPALIYRISWDDKSVVFGSFGDATFSIRIS